MYFTTVFVVMLSTFATSSKIPLDFFEYYPAEHHIHHRGHHNINIRRKLANSSNLKVIYQYGKSEEDLPVCAPNAVCSKLDLYDSPWMERQCRCTKGKICPASLASADGHTISDKTRQYKMCEPVKKLPKCRDFIDITWSLRLKPNNTTEQIIHCHCPKNSVAYLIKRQAFHGIDNMTNYQFSFACSPQRRVRCQRKEPCRLFTVHKRKEFLDEVNMNTLCPCQHGYRCPRHHNDYGVIQGKVYDDIIRTYSGYCIPSGNLT